MVELERCYLSKGSEVCPSTVLQSKISTLCQEAFLMALWMFVLMNTKRSVRFLDRISSRKDGNVLLNGIETLNGDDGEEHITPAPDCPFDRNKEPSLHTYE